MSKLILGCGYLGERVADLWLAEGQRVSAVTRSSQRAGQLRRRGIHPIVADITLPATLEGLPDASCVLFAVGFDRAPGPMLREVYVEGLRHVLAALPPSVERFIYVSSTGVYGQVSGQRVDEDSPCEPVREGGRACLSAERLLTEHPLGKRSIILRMAGLYGPGRIPRSRELLAGQKIAAVGEGCLNLVHVEDAAQVVLAAERHAQPPRLYVVSDGNPVQRREYYRYLAQLLGAPEPVLEAPPADSPAAQRARSDKRIENRRMCAELRVPLRFPSYREGLSAIVQSMERDRARN